MTDDDKALVERLRGDWPEILVEKHWMMDSDAIDKQREEAADRIEAISAENERLRDAFKRPKAWLVSDGETYWVTVFEPRPKDHPYCEIIPLYSAALGETK